MKLSLIILLSSFELYAYTPSVESLFRNGANAEIDSTNLAANFTVKKIEVSSTEEITSAAADVANNLNLKNFQSASFKLLYHTRGKNKELVQIAYDSPEMKSEQVREVNVVGNLDNQVNQKGIEGVEKGLFYSLLNSLFFNDGEMIIGFLRSRGVGVRYNKEVINKPKVKLLERYKDFLTTTRSPNAPGSPLAPTDETARAQARALMKEPFLVESPLVKRIKEKDKFYWKIDSDNFSAYFTNEKRSFERLDLHTSWGNLTVYCKDYMLFDGIHEFPKYMYFKDLNGIFYQIEWLSIKYYSNKDDNSKSTEKYLEALKKNQEAERPLFFKPSFIL